MCRYAYHNYRDHFACFDCRKSFKYWQWEEVDKNAWRKEFSRRRVPREIRCPDCDKPMVDMGLDFKAPRKEKSEEWDILRILSEARIDFHNCGCGVGWVPPKRKREVPAFLEAHFPKSPGKELLGKINQKMA